MTANSAIQRNAMPVVWSGSTVGTALAKRATRDDRFETFLVLSFSYVTPKS